MPKNQRRLQTGLLCLAGLALATFPLRSDIGAQEQDQPAVVNAPEHPLLQGFRWRAIGPVAQGARIDDLAVDENNPATFYIGYAVSGIWKTTNNGTTFASIFDEYTHSIGDLALAPSNANILYVGTGEPNNRQSSSFGEGMYKSTDAGETFTHIGLRDTQSIGRVVVHPTNPDIVYVAAVGHLYGPNEERGVFKTTDGGQTWTKVLYVNQDVGAIEIVMDPSNANTLMASTYERRRTGWGFVGGGPGSGIHKSTDGGRTWTKLSGNGLPLGTMGRVGLDWSRSNPNVVYAQIEVAQDNEPPVPQDAPDPQAGRGGGGRGGRGGGPPDPTRSGIWRSNDKGRTWTFMSNENNRPMYYSQIRIDPNDENTVYVGGVNAMKSTDGAKTFENIQGNGIGHVDNHAIWIDPSNSNHVMYGNDGGLDISYDGAQTFESIRNMAVALPYHVSVAMDRPYTVCTGLQDNGSWCGPSHVRTNAIRTWHWISVGGGDGFQTQVDPTNPNVFYTESQNGNISRYDMSTGARGSIRPRAGTGRGGRGGGGGGRGGPASNVVPPPAPDTDEFNYNWNSPMRISPHNPKMVLYGGNRLFVSTDEGTTWRMTGELGKGIDVTQRTILEQPYSLPGCGRGSQPGQDCIVSKGDGVQQNEFKTIIEIAESAVVPGIYWVGTADGNIQVSRDAGYTWTEVSANLPGGSREYWVSGLEASHHDAGTAYASLDGHHSNDMKPYVFKTTDYGRTWTSISGDLPAFGNVNSIRQDPVNPRLLYAATEYGFYISLDEGGSWHPFMPGLPITRVDEVVVHPREHDLILASHGYGIYVMDDISALQQMDQMPSEPRLFTPRDAVLWKNDFRLAARMPGGKTWSGENAPDGTAIAFYLPQAGSATLTITNTVTNEVFRTIQVDGTQGLNRLQWNLRGNPPAGAEGRAGGRGGGGGGGGRGRGGGGPEADAGVYRVTLTVGGREAGTATFSVLEDVWMNR
jgi:photosystem II stability/assembly factor-like uncharacterized protein